MKNCNLLLTANQVNTSQLIRSKPTNDKKTIFWMFFCPNQLGRPYRTRSYILSQNTLATRPPQTSELFTELASLVRLRLGLLVIFSGELVSPFFQHCFTFFIHILTLIRLDFLRVVFSGGDQFAPPFIFPKELI